MLDSDFVELQHLLHNLTDDPIPSDDWPGPDYSYELPPPDPVDDQPPPPHVDRAAPRAPPDDCPPPEHMSGYSSAEEQQASAAPSGPASPDTATHHTQIPSPPGHPGPGHDYPTAILALLTRTACTARQMQMAHLSHCCYAPMPPCSRPSCQVCRTPRQAGKLAAACSDAALMRGVLLDASSLADAVVAQRAALQRTPGLRAPPRGSPEYDADEAAFSGIVAALQPNPHTLAQRMWMRVRENVINYVRVVTSGHGVEPALAGAPLMPVQLLTPSATASSTPLAAPAAFPSMHLARGSTEPHSGVSTTTGSPRGVVSSFLTRMPPSAPSTPCRPPPATRPPDTPEAVIDPRAFAIVTAPAVARRGAAEGLHASGPAGVLQAGADCDAPRPYNLLQQRFSVGTAAGAGAGAAVRPSMFDSRSDVPRCEPGSLVPPARSTSPERAEKRGGASATRGARRGGGVGRAPRRPATSARRPAQRKATAKRAPKNVAAAAAASMAELPYSSAPSATLPLRAELHLPADVAYSPLWPPAPPGGSAAGAAAAASAGIDPTSSNCQGAEAARAPPSLQGGLSLDTMPSFACDAPLDDGPLGDFLRFGDADLAGGATLEM